jgi:hypothetical protein
MSQSKCSNPDCNKTYHVEDTDADDGFCSFECWEKVNCLQPVHVQLEEFQVL